ncbi:unnamed protein product [Larinioides sclopetarius]
MRDTSKESIRNSLINLTLKKNTAAYIVKELSSIINKLEDDKQKVLAFSDKENECDNGQQNFLSKVYQNDLRNGESLQNFKANLDSQLARLKDLLKNLQTPGSSQREITNFISPVAHFPFNKMDHYYESTPLNSAVELNKMQPSLPASGISASELLEKQRNHSTSLDFTNVLSSFRSQELTNSTQFSSSVISKPSHCESEDASIGLSEFLNFSSPSNLSEKLAGLDLSKLSPIYFNSSSGYDKSLSKRSTECHLSVTPMRSSASVPSMAKACSSTFTLNNDQSLEAMELELQTMLQQIESLLPQVSGLSNDSLEKEKVRNALSDMETAVKKLSHLSLTLSTGSTDL